MHLTCLVDTARLSIVVTETISSRDGDNLPAPPAISNADERMQTLSASISVIYTVVQKKRANFGGL